MGEKKNNSTLTVIVAVAVPLILFLLVKDIADSLQSGDPYGNSEMVAWIIYIAIVAVFEYFWITRD